MSFGPVEAIVVVVVVLVVFGAGRLAGVGKALGQGLREFREEARVEDKDKNDEDEAKSDDKEPAKASDEEKSS